jgi:hypothetical protein
MGLAGSEGFLWRKMRIGDPVGLGCGYIENCFKP